MARDKDPAEAPSHRVEDSQLFGHDGVDAHAAPGEALRRGGAGAQPRHAIVISLRAVGAHVPLGVPQKAALATANGQRERRRGGASA